MRRSAAGVGLALLLLAAVVLVSYRSVSTFLATQRFVARSREAVDALREVLSELRLAEMDRRGYILTGRERYLEAYRGAVERLNPKLERLRAVFSHDPARARKISELEPLLLERIAHMNRALEDYHRHPHDLRRQAALIGEGSELTEKILGAVERMDAEESLRQSRRERRAAESARLAQWIILLGSLLGFAMLGGAAWLSLSQMRARRQSQQALQDANRFLDSIVENIPDMVFVKDARELRFVRVNKAGEELMGRGRQELLGKNDHDLFPKKEADFFNAKDREVLSSARLLNIPVEPLRSARGGVRLLHTKKIPILDASGKPRYLLGISADITARKQAEQIKDEMIAMTSHDMRTPLTVILGTLEMIGERLPGGAGASDRLRELADIAKRNAQQMLRLLDDFLLVTKLEAGQMSFDLKPLELMPLVSEAIRIDQPYGTKFGVSFVLTRGVPQALVKADADRLMRVMANLLSNAAKFSRRGSSVEVSVSRREKFLRVSVADKGLGIPEEFRSRVFQKFAQAEQPSGAKRRGTGLGLSIAKAIIESLGGRIFFESAAGAGATFHFELPEIERGGA